MDYSGTYSELFSRYPSDCMTDRLLSVDEVDTFLGVQRDTVYEWIKRYGLPARKVDRLWKFRQKEVDQWFNKQPGRQQASGRNSPDERGRRG
jgi:excisionase family DNA binding protein